MKNTHKNGVYKKKRMKKGQTMKNPGNFKLDCPNKLQIFSSTFTKCCFKGEWKDKKRERKEWKRDKQWKIRVTLNSIVPISYKCSLVPLQIVVSRVNEGIESML